MSVQLRLVYLGPFPLELKVLEVLGAEISVERESFPKTKTLEFWEQGVTQSSPNFPEFLKKCKKIMFRSPIPI